MYYNNYSYRNRIPTYSKLIFNLQIKFDKARKQLGNKALDLDFYIRRADTATWWRNDERTCKQVFNNALSACHVYSITYIDKKLKKFSKAYPNNDDIKNALNKITKLPKTHAIKYNQKGMLEVPYKYAYADSNTVRTLNYQDVTNIYNYIQRAYNPNYSYIDMSKVGAPTSDEHLHEVKITVDNQPCYLEMNGK